MWILGLVTVLILVAMVITVLRLIEQSDEHVDSVKGIKVRVSKSQFARETTESDRILKADFEKDPDREEAVYPHWDMTKSSMKLLGRMRNVTKLSMADSTFENSWLRYIEKLPLKWLELPGTDVDNEGLQHIAKITSLRHLDIFDTKISGKNLSTLAPLVNLEALAINGTETNDEDLVALKAFPKLRELNVSGTYLTDAGCVELANLQSLQALRIGKVALSAAGMNELKKLKSVHFLDVRDCGLDDQCAEILSTFSSLQQLDMSSNPITDKGLMALSKLPKLYRLSIGECPKITPAGLEKFRAAKPKCIVEQPAPKGI